MLMLNRKKNIDDMPFCKTLRALSTCRWKSDRHGQRNNWSSFSMWRWYELHCMSSVCPCSQRHAPVTGPCNTYDVSMLSAFYQVFCIVNNVLSIELKICLFHCWNACCNTFRRVEVGITNKPYHG